MGRYDNKGNYLSTLDEAWNDEKFQEIEKKTNLKSLSRVPSRENLMRAFDLAMGKRLEDTFAPEDGAVNAGHRQTAQRFVELMELAAGEVDAKIAREEAEKAAKEAEKAAKEAEKAAKEEEKAEQEPEKAEAKEEKSEAKEEKAEPSEEEKKEAQRKAQELQRKKDNISAMVQEVYVAGHYDLPEHINPMDNQDSQTWVADALDYMYYMAVRKMTEVKIPDIDYRVPAQVKECADACGAYGHIMQDLVQISDGEYGDHLAEKYPDFKQRKEELITAALVELAVADLGTEMDAPPKKGQMLKQLKARMIMEQYGERLRGNMCGRAEEMAAFHNLAMIQMVAAPFLESLKWNEDHTLDTAAGEKEQALADYMDRKPDSFCPIIVKGDQVYLSPVLDKRTPKLDLDQVKEDYARGKKAAIFDKMFEEFPDDPTHNTEPAYKRIYIDGKNAYDLFKGNYKGTGQEIEEAVKADIVDTLAKGTNRVEMARMVQQRDGQMKAYVVPVRADLKVLDANKKWYQPSMAKQEEKLWTSDPEAAVRREAIAKEAQTRNQDNFYKGMLEAANAVRREYMGTDKAKKEDFLEAERRMQAEPELAREWGIQKMAQAYQTVKEVPNLLHGRGGNIDYGQAVAAVQMVSAAQEGVNNCSLNDLAVGRQFKEAVDTVDKIIAMEMPDAFYNTYELEEMKRQREVYKRRWDREDQQAKEHPLTQEEQDYRMYKRAETLDDLREEAGRRFEGKMLPYAEVLADRMKDIENRDIIALADDARRAELDEHFIGKEKAYKKLTEEGNVPHSDVSAYDPFNRVRSCNEKVIETVTKKFQDGFNPEAAPDVCRGQFRALRQVMESIGISQQEVDAYAENLNPEQKAAYEYVRSWEKNLVRQEEGKPIELPNGISNIKEASDLVAGIYKHAYCKKMGFVNRLDPVFMEKMQEKVKVPAMEPITRTKVDYKTLQAKEKAGKTEKKTEPVSGNSRRLSVIHDNLYTK